MFSAKNIAFVVVILILLAGNIWLYTRTVSLDGEVEALLDALSRPSESETDFEVEITALTQQLREEQGERTRQTGRAASLEHTTKAQKREIAQLQIKFKTLEAEVRRHKQAGNVVVESSSSTQVVEALAEGVAEVETTAVVDAVESTVTQTTESAAEVVAAGISTQTSTAAAATAENTDEGGVHDIEYVIKRGDLLEDLARTYYGDSTQWKRILEANSDVVSDARSLQVGMKLTIPDVPR
jgi:nucleoid-associated protein YgaU